MKTKEDYKNEFWNQIISEISYNYYDDFGEDYEEQIDQWAATFANRRMKEQEENNKELTKYKRAFEILKDNLQFRFIGNCFQVCINNHWYFIKEYNLEKEREQYEMLEELIGNESAK